METLMVEFAEILGVGIDKAIELYPIIKSQFITYSIIENVTAFMEIIMIIGVCGLVGTGVFTVAEYSSMWKDENNLKLYKKLLKISAITVLVLSISLIGVNALKYILAPDFMIIREFLN